MARTSANCTSEARERWLLRKRHPDYQPPRYEQLIEKQPGSKTLRLGQWVEEGE